MPPKPGSKQNVTDLNKDQLTSLATKIARSVNPDPNFISAFLGLIQAESSWRPSIWGFTDAERERQGKDRAFGLTQLLATTAKELGVDRFNVDENLLGGAMFLLKQLERFGSYELAFAAYNAGPGKVAELGRAPRFPQTIKHWKVAQADIADRGGWPNVDATTGIPAVAIIPPTTIPPAGLPRFTPAPDPVLPRLSQAPPGQGVSQALQAQAPGISSLGVPSITASAPIPTTSPTTQINPVGQALLKNMLGTT